MLHVNVDCYHTTNRTATTNGPISLAGAASLGKCGYGNGIAVMERISGTILQTTEFEFNFYVKSDNFFDFKTVPDIRSITAIPLP